MKCGERFIKNAACLHDVIFISQQLDWVLCIISECDWMNYFECREFIIVKKNFEYILGNTKNSN